jgi:chemotaxis signal transduction protein
MIAESGAVVTLTGTTSAKLAAPGRASASHFVGFRLGGQSYALPLDHVERALRMVAVPHVPESPPWVVGE